MRLFVDQLVIVVQYKCESKAVIVPNSLVQHEPDALNINT